MITRIPDHLWKVRQVRWPLSKIRRGRKRKAAIRRLTCEPCGGTGGMVWPGESDLVCCYVCRGGLPAPAFRPRGSGCQITPAAAGPVT